jgi:hypothetical protein
MCHLHSLHHLRQGEVAGLRWCHEDEDDNRDQS